MARRNSTGQGGRYAAPAPLYGRVADLRPPAAASAPARTSARAALEDMEMRVRRYPSPIPAPASASDQQSVDLLRRQNELLTEILGVLNAQLAVGLGQRPR